MEKKPTPSLCKQGYSDTEASQETLNADFQARASTEPKSDEKKKMELAPPAALHIVTTTPIVVML